MGERQHGGEAVDVLPAEMVWLDAGGTCQDLLTDPFSEAARQHTDNLSGLLDGLLSRWLKTR